MKQLFMNSWYSNHDGKGSCWRSIFSKPMRSILMLLSLLLVFSANIYAQDTTAMAPPNSPQGNLDQIRNGNPNLGPVIGCGTCWVNGNAGCQQAHYTEGWSIPYRLKLTGMSNGLHTIVIEWDITGSSGNKHALDYITHYQNLDPNHLDIFGHAAEVIDPTFGTSFSGAATSTFAIPPHPDATTNASKVALNRNNFSAWGATIVSMTYGSSVTALSSPVPDGLKNEMTIVIDVTSGTGNAMLAWGAHIASQEDWGFGNSASNISGSPYHTRLLSVDGSGGNQDRSLQSCSVIIPPDCEHEDRTACAGQTLCFSKSINASNDNTNYTYSIVGANTANASIISGGSGTVSGPSTSVPNVCIKATQAGSYVVQLHLERSTLAGLLVHDCYDTVTVTAIGGSASITNTGFGLSGPESTPSCSKLYRLNIRQNNVANFAVTGAPLGASFNWSIISPPVLPSSVNFVSNSSTGTGTFTITSAIPDPVAPGPYKFVVKIITPDSCIATDTICLDVSGPCPSIFIGGPDTTCYTGSVTYNYVDNLGAPISPSALSLTFGTFNYTWSVSNIVGIGSVTPTSGTVNPSAFTVAISGNVTSYKVNFTVVDKGPLALPCPPQSKTTYLINPEAGDISQSQTLCKGSCPAQLTGTAPSSGAGCVVAYQWQSAASCSGPWANVGTGQNYTPACPFNTNSSYRRIASVTCSGVTCYDTSNCVTITVIDPEAGDISQSQTVCKGSCPSQLTGGAPTAGSCTVAYQWQSAATCSGPWTNVGTGQNYSPACPFNTTTSYRRITSVTCNSITCRDTSNCVTITVNDPEAGDISSSQTICKGSCPSQLTGGAPTAGSCTVAYQWQSAATCAGPWTNVGTGQNYTPACPFTANTSYRRITSVTCNSITCYDTSNCVSITINDPEAGDISQSQTICKGSCASQLTGGAPTAGSCTVAYQWQSAASCAGSWSNIVSGGISQNYTPCPNSTTSYRRITSVTCNGVTCRDTSNCVTITVNDPEAGNISASQTLCPGTCPSPLTGGAPVAGSCTVSYQWQSAATCAGPWTNVGTGQNYTPPCPFTTTTSYRRITTLTCGIYNCYDTSNCVTITINTVTAGAIGRDTVICSGELPGTFTGTAGTGSGSISYEWLKSEVGCSGPWIAIPTSNSQNYTPGALSNTTYYKRVTISTLNSVACRDTSNCVTATVNTCGTNCTYTQGYYGSPGKSCDGVTRYMSATSLIAELLGVNSTPRPMTLGAGAHSIFIGGTLADAQRINQVMPGGKTPRALPSTLPANTPLLSTTFNTNCLSFQGRINNVFLSQTLALSLNARMNGDRLAGFRIKLGWLTTQKLSGCGPLASPVPCSVDEGSIKSRNMNTDVFNYLTNCGANTATVANLISLANDVLGGVLVPGTSVPGKCVPVPSYSSISGMCGAFNEVFDECRSYVGYFQCQQTCDNFGLPCASQPIALFERGAQAATVKTTPKVEVFPNPYHDNVSFIINSPVAAKGSLKVYNAMGQLVSVVFQGEVSAGKSKNIRFNVPVANGGLFYIYEQSGQKLTGKLIKQ